MGAIFCEVWWCGLPPPIISHRFGVGDVMEVRTMSSCNRFRSGSWRFSWFYFSVGSQVYSRACPWEPFGWWLAWSWFIIKNANVIERYVNQLLLTKLMFFCSLSSDVWFNVWQETLSFSGYVWSPKSSRLMLQRCTPAQPSIHGRTTNTHVAG